MVIVGWDIGADNDSATIVIARKLEDGRLEIVEARKVGPPLPGAILVSECDGRQHWALNLDRLLLEAWLRRRRVGPEIIERVIRLNPNPKPYEVPRGMHYKEPGRYLLHLGAASKGEIIRRYGREVWDRIPREDHRKYGRRVYVTARDVALARGT